MANQSMMVPPNNAPWPGLQAPPHSQTPTSPPTYSHTHHAHTSSYPPPSPYYHHPPPPPHHPHHGPPPPPPPHHYPYHPYAAPYPPPYGPAHSSSLPGYHHPPPHHAAPPPHASHDPSSSTAAAGGEALSGSISSSSGAGKVIKAKPASTTTTTKTKTGKLAGSESSDSAANGSSTTTATPGTKTFRFEGSISSESFKTTKSFDLAGVNILNRKPLDARTALDKLQRRRETHNRVERKRRDCINQLIDDLTKLLPPKHLEEASSKCHRVNVLRGAVAHIKFLSDSNNGLSKTLDAAKNEGFKIPEIIDVVPAETTAADSNSADNSTADQQAMSMDVDMEDDAQANSVKQEATDDEEVQMKDASNNSTPSRTTSPTAASSSSASPRLTPSKILGQPQLIITNAPSPKTEHPSSREGIRPPPISISSAPVDPYSLDSHPPTGSSISESTTPASPAFLSSPKSDPSAASSSPSARQGSFQAKDNSKQLLQQQLSPFLQTISLSTSPSLPPISSLANLKIQSPSARVEGPSPGERHFEERPSSPSLRSTAAPTDSNSSSGKNNGSTHQRNGPTLPPLKIPAPQHLHPSYKQGGGGAPSTHDSRVSNRSGPTLSPHQHATSPHHHQRGPEGGDHQHSQQPPVSPFMLSPLMSRSPSMGPLSASSAGTSPYPHWGHEGPDGAPPLPPPHHHQGQYLPPHGYPHGYPYPYPYHPSYGYHHPPPPHHHPHHHHHAPPSPHSPQHRPTSPHPPVAVATATRPTPPEPIFIQEEPWNVQRKRNASNTASGKNQSGKQQNGAAAAKKAKEGSVIREESATPIPVSPTSSVASSAQSYPNLNNHRKRPSSSSHHPNQHHQRENSYGESGNGDETVVKRVRQHDDSSSTSPRLELNQNGQDHRQGPSDQQQQRDSGIVVVVVKADDEDSHHHHHHHQQHQQPLSPATSSHHDEMMTVDQSGGHHNHRDAAQALTSLSQNA
ncbi:hypothetical protein BGX24_010956 [Mortierella sp. AD032]|nr:hypothetical protein BGX24_010956 [Mortierella sp. AD032]